MKKIICLLYWAIVIILIVLIFFIIKKQADFGFDVKGGSRIVIEAQETENIEKITPDMMEALTATIDRRINPNFIPEITIKQIGDKRLLIKIPTGIDLEEVREKLTQTADLEFKKPIVDEKDNVIGWESSGLTGANLEKAESGTDGTGRWIVNLTFNREGAIRFRKLTNEFKGLPIAIYFNGESISEPIVISEILDGKAVITGPFTREKVKEMVDLLNAGALPLPVKIIEENIEY